jgi:hypothetical protein
MLNPLQYFMNKIYTFLILVLFPFFGHSQNLLETNPDFETGDLSGFNVFGNFGVTTDAATGTWALIGTVNSNPGGIYAEYITRIPFDGVSNYRLTGTIKVSGPFNYAGIGMHYMFDTDSWQDQADIPASFGNEIDNSFTVYTVQSTDIMAADVNALPDVIEEFRLWIYAENPASPTQSLFVDDLFFETISTLPVTLTHFSAKVLNISSAKIVWTTASEWNAKEFIVQKSEDLIKWHEVGRVEASGNSSEEINYQFVDRSFDKDTFYRLKQVDFDGSTEIFEPFLLRANNQLIDFSVFPNPTTNKIVLRDLPTTITSIAIISNSGKTVKKFEGVFSESFEIDLNDLPSQAYHVILFANKGVLATKLVIKN